MKRNGSWKKYLFYLFLSLLALGLIFLIAVFLSPSTTVTDNNTVSVNDSSPDYYPSIGSPAIIVPPPSPVGRPSKKIPAITTKPSVLNNYSVALAVTDQMQFPGPIGRLTVWIGNQKYKPTFPERMSAVSKPLPTKASTIAARIVPFAPDFEISPSEKSCIKIAPSGSEMDFQLIPKKTGTFYVSANIDLFDTEDCSNAPQPKTSTELKVIVEVNYKGILNDKSAELGTIFWDKLLDFWGALVALIFALLLFLIRGKLKQWFSFSTK